MLRVVDVHHDYGEAGRALPALRGVDLLIPAHSYVSVTGPSGCGKSTLLNLLGALDRPTRGAIFLDGMALHAADDAARTRYRRRDLGMVFQFFHLLPGFTLEENVALPLLLAGTPRRAALGRAAERLELVGLADRRRYLVSEVSGGELQRAAIARALVHDPRVLLADEPTGNLDSGNTERVLDIFDRVHRARLATLVIATHSEAVARAAGRRIRMRDGRVEEDAEVSGAPASGG